MCIVFYGRVKSKRFDEFGHCYIGLDIENSYKTSHINNIENIESHKPRCDEFKIINDRPLSCVNDIDLAKHDRPLSCVDDIDLAKHSELGDRVVIKACELYDLNGIPVNYYHTLSFDNWH